MLKPLLTLSLLLSPASYAQTSRELYTKGRLNQAFFVLQKELVRAKDEDVEALLSLALDILAHSKGDKLPDVLKLYRSAEKKKLMPYLVQRISYELKALQEWKQLKKLSAEELNKKVEEAAAMPEAHLIPNLEKRSLLRVYDRVAQWNHFRHRDPQWLIASSKAQYALGKSGLNVLKEFRSLETTSVDFKTDVDRMLEDQE